MCSPPSLPRSPWHTSCPPMFSDQIIMPTTRDAGGPRARWGGWRTLGFLGAALVLPGGLVLLLFLIARPRLIARLRPRAVSPVGDPYLEWLRTRDRLRSDRPAAGVAVVLSSSHQPNGSQLART